MPNATVRANAQVMSDDPKLATPDQRAARLKYEVAYSEWLAAKAATFNPDLDGSDVVANERNDRLRAAQMTLITTPAPLDWAILQKLEFVEGMVTDDYGAGKPNYPLAVLAIAAVKADYLAILNGE